VTGASADHQPYLLGGRCPPHHDSRLGERDNVGVGGDESFERLVNRGVGVVDQFLVDVDLR
jgi:hypothetical protein